MSNTLVTGHVSKITIKTSESIGNASSNADRLEKPKARLWWTYASWKSLRFRHDWHKELTALVYWIGRQIPKLQPAIEKAREPSASVFSGQDLNTLPSTESWIPLPSMISRQNGDPLTMESSKEGFSLGVGHATLSDGSAVLIFQCVTLG